MVTRISAGVRNRRISLTRIASHLGDNCIQIFHLGRYIVGYTIGNFVLRRRISGAVNVISDRIYDDILPQIKILNMVIPILIYFLTFTHRKYFIVCKT